MRAPILEARGLHTYYGASHILQGVDLTVRAGEVVGLMGRNGMGKTTLLRSILGQVPSLRGDIMIHGKPMTGAAPHRIAREGIGYVPEGRGIFPNLSVRENLVIAARSRQGGRNEWSYGRVLELFPRLAKRLSHGGQQLSGGEQQMLAIGRALMTNPDLLILDEATEGLAPLVAREIWLILRAIGDSGLGAIIVDKNFPALSQVATRSLIMVKGRIVFDNATNELRVRPELLHQHLGI
jgi:branched-chain amino acid transport system ATP-binding protein